MLVFLWRLRWYVRKKSSCSFPLWHKKLAGVAVPYIFMPLLSPVMVAVVAVERVLCSSSWEVIFTESLRWWYSRWMTNSFTAAVLPNGCLHQVNSKGFYWWNSDIDMIFFHSMYALVTAILNKKNLMYGIVLSKLITVIHPSHELFAKRDRLGAAESTACTVPCLLHCTVAGWVQSDWWRSQLGHWLATIKKQSFACAVWLCTHPVLLISSLE